MNFSDFKLNKQLYSAIDDLGYSSPTEIQKKAIPNLLAGHDVIGVAQTGTGKTAAFLLPLLMKIKYAQEPSTPRAIILEPTRELAIQVENECKKLAKYTDIRFTAIYGGIGPTDQIYTIKSGIDILIATPGRLMDFYKKKQVDFKQVSYLILDEADRMLDMGFLPQINALLEVVPRKRQNALFSATMPESVKNLSYNFLEFPVEIEVTPQSTPAETVNQSVYLVPNFKSKINLLGHFLKNDSTFEKVLIFTKTKTNADNIFKFIERKITKSVRVIHSNKGQNTRINSINAFQNNEVHILVSTDVTSRGIDIEKVSHVVNFDVPPLYEDYVHRIGRTGRAFNTGFAITFANEAEQYHIKKIEEIIKMPIPVAEIPAGVLIEKTPFEEAQLIARELDHLRRKDDPEFKGAFHEKADWKKKKIKKKKK